MQTILVDCQVISKDFTWQDKAKRFGRSLWQKGKDFINATWYKAREAAKAIAHFFSQLHTTSNRCVDEMSSIFEQIKQDWNEEKGMGFLQQIGDFLLGPSGPTSPDAVGNYTEFSTGNVGGSMMGVVVSQRGYVSSEQVEQFGAIATESTANLKRLNEALKHIKTVDGNETEATKQVFKLMDSLDRNAHKRRQYEYDHSREHNLLQEKFSNLRRGL